MEIPDIIAAILEFIREQGGAVKADFSAIAKSTKQQISTIWNLLPAMIDDGYIVTDNRTEGLYFALPPKASKRRKDFVANAA